MTDIVSAFVDAYPPYVRDRLVASGWSGVDVSHATEEGKRWLEQELKNLIQLPFAEQRRGPLELFQEALRFPTQHLLEAGIEPVDRDETVRHALPGDVFDLAPASSRHLGEDAWRAHLAWGAAKAAQLTPPPSPQIGYFGTNLMDRSKIEHVAAGRGFDLASFRDVEGLDDAPHTVVVDLQAADADEAIRVLADRGSRVVAFGPHVDDVAMMRARTLGATAAMPRSRFFRDPELWLPTLM